eukprot:7362875-Prymnesium_polylepis.1
MQIGQVLARARQAVRRLSIRHRYLLQRWQALPGARPQSEAHLAAATAATTFTLCGRGCFAKCVCVSRA